MATKDSLKQHRNIVNFSSLISFTNCMSTRVVLCCQTKKKNQNQCHWFFIIFFLFLRNHRLYFFNFTNATLQKNSISADYSLQLFAERFISFNLCYRNSIICYKRLFKQQGKDRYIHTMIHLTDKQNRHHLCPFARQNALSR